MKPSGGGNFADTMKETLLGIETVDRKKVEIDKQMAHFELLLKQINIAATLYRQYITSLDKHAKYDFNTTDVTVPVKCLFKARISEGETPNNILIDCEITNLMPCSLSCDWGVMVTVEPTNSNEDSVSRSFKLDSDFGTSQSIIVSIPVNPKLILAEMKAAVFFILQLSFKNRETVRLCVPVHQRSIDALYFLYSDRQELRNMNMKSLESSLLHEELLKIAKTRPSCRYIRLLGS